MAVGCDWRLGLVQAAGHPPVPGRGLGVYRSIYLTQTRSIDSNLIYSNLSMSLVIHPSVRLTACLSVSVPNYLRCLSVYQCICPSTHLSLHVYVHILLHMHTYLHAHTYYSPRHVRGSLQLETIDSNGSEQCGLTARMTQPQPTHLECQGRRTDSRSDRPDTDPSRGPRCGRHHTRASCRTGRTDKRRGVIRRTRLKRLAASWMPALQGRRVLCRAAPDGVLFSARGCF